ncbi:mitochondrial ribosomal subunit S27-domain-containing protein [Peziza echinospora]|nr:mitochondrial ribosomal subunit S27-domain-containing protein [Peziza echinospora]
MSVLPARSRLLQLSKLSCQIFSTTYNPTNARLGNKILRQKLKGPTILSYYPKQEVTIKDLARQWPDRQFVDVDEAVRLEDVTLAKIRGKGAPKKKRTKVEHKRKR